MSRLFANKKLVITIVCLFLLYSTWGTVYLFIRFALESFPPVMLSGMRYVCAGSALLIWSFFVKKERRIPTVHDFKVIFLCSFFMITLSGAMLNISEVYISSGVAALLLGSVPLWMVVSEWLSGHEERPSAAVMFGLAGGFIGIVMLGFSAGLEQSGSAFGVFCAFCSVFGWVAGSLYSKNHRLSVPIIKSLGFQMITGGVLMLVFANFIGEYDEFSLSGVSFKSWFAFIHLVVFGSLIGYICYMWLLFNTPTPVAVSHAYVEPVVAVIIGAVFASEVITWGTVWACILIIFSVFFVMKGKHGS